MNMKYRQLSTLLMLVSLFFANAIIADDMNDGIGIDETLKDDLEKDVNFQYIIAKAKGRANTNATMAERDAKKACDGIGNINFGPASRFGNNVTIIRILL
jgi:hypothetical protein